jgi:hypothetical protein
MPGILDDNYGVADARRERRNKLIVVGLLLAIAVGVIGYFSLRTWRQEQVLKEFLATLDRKEFQQAYRMWGCTPETPCKYYDADRFNQDWGPSTAYSHGSSAKIDNIDFCDAGVVFQVSFPNADPVSLWVERSTNLISFAPWPRCPGRHWEFGRFFKSLFS